ncbi:NUDIX domain-containing protein [bacterium]|nr:NUDIX domain-containing protein [bacterium]
MKRIRGTGIVVRNGKILLVRDRKKTRFSLPGGKANRNEPALAAAIRELYEECHMTAVSAERLPECDYTGSLSSHKVCMLQSPDEPELGSRELSEYRWWDMAADIPRYPHVDFIISRFQTRHMPGE